jgi:hypothetical protein
MLGGEWVGGGHAMHHVAEGVRATDRWLAGDGERVGDVGGHPVDSVVPLS